MKENEWWYIYIECARVAIFSLLDYYTSHCSHVFKTFFFFGAKFLNK